MSKAEEVFEELDREHVVSLEEMLWVRENRVKQQEDLFQQFGTNNTVICFTMNIAGPVKAFELAGKSFLMGIERIQKALAEAECEILYQTKEMMQYGNTAYFIVKESSEKVKRWMTVIEDADKLGRLFDIDVLTKERKVSRGDIGLPERTCLICGEKAVVCARSRCHTVEELQKRTIAVMLEQDRK